MAKAKKPKKPLVSEEDTAMFLEAIGGATPLGKRDRLPVPPQPAVVKVVVHPVEVKLAFEGEPAKYSARAPGVSLAQIAELRKMRAEEELDLHGETIAKALEKLAQFLVAARRTGRRCVRIVHGKGTHSEVGAPLREAVVHALLGQYSGYVKAMATAAQADGGEGATTVWLGR